MSSLPIVSIAAIARATPSASGRDIDVVELRRDHLPRDAELVDEPAALARPPPSAVRIVPVVVDLRLVLAVEDERERLVEGERRAGVEERGAHAVDRELDDELRALGDARRARWRGRRRSGSRCSG